jgi:hypothetical protein
MNRTLQGKFMKSQRRGFIEEALRLKKFVPAATTYNQDKGSPRVADGTKGFFASNSPRTLISEEIMKRER